MLPSFSFLNSNNVKEIEIAVYDDPWSLCDEAREKIVERLENWSRCLEDAGLNVRMSKTERLQLAENL